MKLYFQNFHLKESSFLKSSSILLKFDNWAFLKHFFLPIGRDNSRVYFVLLYVLPHERIISGYICHELMKLLFIYPFWVGIIGIDW